MAVGSIASLFNAAVALTGKAVPKAVGIIGDDIAVNAHQLEDLPPGRNMPALLKVAKGSLLNKAALIPFALGLSWFFPAGILPLLAVGGFYLTAHGMEQIKGGHHGHDKKPETEKEKVAGALKIDAILSAELTMLTLGVVAAAPIVTQLAVLATTGLALTGILYGAIGAIIGMGPLGKWLQQRQGDSAFAKTARSVGRAVTRTAPLLMKTVSVLGTAAMFMVGGELLLGAVPGAAGFVAHLAGQLTAYAPAALTAAIPAAIPALTPLAEHALFAVAGLGASLFSYPAVQMLEGPAQKLATRIAGGISAMKQKIGTLLSRKKDAPDTQAAIKQAPPTNDNVSQALRRAADAKAALNNAAAKNDAPAMQAAPKTPENKPVPPKPAA